MLITNATSEIAFNLGYSDLIWATLSCLPLARMCHLLLKLKEISVLVIILSQNVTKERILLKTNKRNY